MMTRLIALVVFFGLGLGIVCGDRVEDWLKRDADGNGGLELAEIKGQMKANFQSIDTNGDGSLDKGELKALANRLEERKKGEQQGGGNAVKVPEGVVFKEDVVYREGNEMWKLDLAYPEGKAEGALRPGIVIVHGGGWRSGDKGGGQWRSLPLAYAAKGYVAISVNYRLSGSGAFPACIEDVKCAVRWLRAHAEEYGMDPKRVGAYGNSAGGHLVSMLGLAGPEAKLEGDGPYQEYSSMVQAVCAAAPPTDFSIFPVKALFSGERDTWGPQVKAASPVSYVTKAAPPFLIVHGKRDTTVPFKQAQVLADRLKEVGAEVELMVFDDAGHGVFMQKASETHPAMEAFFEKALAAKK